MVVWIVVNTASSVESAKDFVNGSTHLTSVLHVVQIVPEVWDDPIRK